MAVNRQRKEEVLAKLNDQFGRAKSIVFVANKGISVADTMQLRKECFDNGMNFHVAKKTLFRIAAEKNNVPLEDDMLNGPVGAIISYEDEVAPARVAHKHSKGGDDAVLEVTGGVIDGRAATVADIKSLALLPSREELVAKVLAGFNSPIAGFANVTAGPLRGFAQVLKAISEQK